MDELYLRLAALARRFGAKRLVLFGSRARGDNRPNSDMDLAVYGMPPDNRAEFWMECEDLPTLLKFDIVHMQDGMNPAFVANIEKDGVELMDKLHEKYNGSEEDKEAQEMAKNSQSKLDEAAAAKAAEEAQGYETGITYDQLARTPDDFKGKKVKFTGKVVQVIEGSGSIQIRLAVNDNYDTILFVQYDSSIVGSRVLEDDHITIYGTSAGTISYQSTMGGTITIPGVSIEKIDQ